MADDRPGLFPAPAPRGLRPADLDVPDVLWRETVRERATRRVSRAPLGVRPAVRLGDVVEGVCPRCGDGLPSCADPGYTHEETCAKYRHTVETCAKCTAEMEVGA